MAPLAWFRVSTREPARQNDSCGPELIEVRRLLERHDYLNLNRGAAGQLGDTNTGPRMGAAVLAKQFKD